MKVVLSRKGFDSTYGGYPSLILPNKEMITLPIPGARLDTKYYDLKTRSGKSLYSIMHSIKGTINKNQKLTPNTTCHLDPDICDFSVKRAKGWTGAFGQDNAAATVLKNEDIKEGDLFIFFGWYNDVVIEDGKYSFKNGQGRHTMFGYFQVDKIYHPNEEDVPSQFKSHPHVVYPDRKNNTLYVAKKVCTFDKKIKGYGMFKYDEELDLTQKGMTKSRWNLPDIFKMVKIKYHSKDSWKKGYFQSAGRGQEFVIEENKDIEKWAINLIKKHSANRVK